jgi:general transcription factor 3C polypeptide 3 (transcription factor C subunit 4)
MAMGICHQHLKDNAAALEALRWGESNSGSYCVLPVLINIVVSVQPDNLDARLRLANVLEDSGHKAEALDMVSEVLRLRASETVNPRTRGPTVRSKQTKADTAATRSLNKRILEDQMRHKMAEYWEEVQEAEAGIASGNIGALDKFVSAAGVMIENFRLAKRNFQKNRVCLNLWARMAC